MDNSLIGKTCPYCQFPIKQDLDIVVCNKCQIPHHKECWQENGGCTTFGCEETSSTATTQDILNVSLDDQAKSRTVATGGGINTFLAVTLVISISVMVWLVFRPTAVTPVVENVPRPTQQPTTKTTQPAEEIIYYVIVEPGKNLFIRKSPGREGKHSSDVITKVPRGTQFKLIDNHNNSIKIDGFTWWEINVVDSEVSGWVASEYISTNRSDVYR